MCKNKTEENPDRLVLQYDMIHHPSIHTTSPPNPASKLTIRLLGILYLLPMMMMMIKDKKRGTSCAVHVWRVYGVCSSLTQ